MTTSNYKEAKQLLKSIKKNREKVLLIHYACESFNKSNTSPRVTSIAVMDYNTHQTYSFSFCLSYEIMDNQSSYDAIEKQLLTDFFDFVNCNERAIWIHWNMRSVMYGFQALEHRFKVLGGNPVDTYRLNKVDLSILLDNYYGDGYIDDPKMLKLLRLNKLNEKEFLDGITEAEAFEKCDYLKVQNSTLRKVHTFAKFLDLAENNKLKTYSKWYKRFGFSIQGIYDCCNGKWWFNLIIFVLGAVFSTVLGNIMEKLINIYF